MEKVLLSPTISLIIYYSKQFPKSRICNIILFYLQVLPILILTHDWNLCYRVGVSFWIRKLILIDCFTFFQSKGFYSLAILIIFIMGILQILFFYKLRSNLIKRNSLSILEKKVIKILTYFLYIPFYFINQFLYSIYTETFFCLSKPISMPYGLSMEEITDCRGVGYILFKILIIINIIFSILFTILCHLLLHKAFYIPNHSLINSLGSIHYFPIISPFIQAILQLEYHISFTHILILKNFARFLFAICYLLTFIKHYELFTNKYLNYSFQFALSMCFISCIIEWGFLYDVRNSNLILIGDYGTIILKLLIEILAAKCILSLYYKKEYKILNEFIRTIILSKKKKNHNVLMNKLFLFVYQLKDFNTFYLFSNSILNICKEQNTIKASVNLNNIASNTFCTEYLSQFKIEVFQEQQEHFRKMVKDKEKKIIKTQLSIKTDFPLFFNFLKYAILSTISKAKGTKNSYYLHSHINMLLFDLIFEENILKCLLSIEKIKRTSLYKRNCIFRLQVHLMKNYLIKNNRSFNQETLNEKYKNQNDNNITSCFLHINYKSLQTISLIEVMIRDCLQDYIGIMNVFNDEDIQFKHVISLIEKFQDKYLNIKLRCLSLKKTNHCCIPYSSKKFELFFNYFHEILPKDISHAFNHFFTRSSAIKIDEEYSILLLKVDLTRANIQFTIDYASTDIILKLNYTYEDFYKSFYDNFFPKSFVRPYLNIFEDMINKGMNFVKINNFCLIDKEKFLLVFDLIGIPVFGSNTLKIFIKLLEIKEDKIVQKQRKRINKKKKSMRKFNQRVSVKNMVQMDNDISRLCGNCYFFANKSGKIISISKGFGDFFYLNSDVIAKHKLSVKDLLKIEVLNSENCYTKSLNDIYENIIQLNNETVGQIGEDDFSKAILSMKETQRNIERNGNNLLVMISYEKKHLKIIENEKKKSFFIFVLQIYHKDCFETQVAHNSKKILLNSEKDTFSSLAYSCNNLNSIDQLSIVNQQTQDIDSGSKYEYILNKIDCQEKILVIRSLSFKLLEMYFGYKFRIQGLEKYSLTNYVNEDKETNQNEPITPSKLKLSISLKIKESKHLNELIKKQYLNSTCYSFKEYGSLMIILLLFFCFIALTFDQMQLKKNIVDSFDLYGDFIIVFNRLIVVIQNILFLQIQSNGLQKKTIDNKFSNSFEYYHNELPSLLKDFVIFSNKLVEFITLNQHSVYSPKIVEKLGLLYQFQVMNRDGTKGFSSESLENVNYIQLNIRQIINSGSYVIYYNKSDYYVKNVESYYSQYEYVKVIENFLSMYRYAFADTILSFPEFFLFSGFDKQKQLSVGLMCHCLIYILFMYLFIVLFLKTKMSLFAKYFVNYTQLRFFNVFIMKKTQLVLNFLMNNGDKTKDMKDIIASIGLVNDKNEMRDLKCMLSDQNNTSIAAIRVNPFKIKLNREIITSRYLNKSIDNACSNTSNNNIITSKIRNSSINILNQTNNESNSLNPFKSKQESYHLTYKSMTKQSNKNVLRRHESHNQYVMEKKSSKNVSDTSSINAYSILSSNKLMLNNNSTSNITTNTPTHTHGNDCNTNTPISLSVLNRQNNRLSSIHQAKRKLLDKQFTSFFFLISISFLLTGLLVMNVIEIFMNSYSIEINKSMLEAENCVFRQIELISSLLVAYQIIILKNEVLVANYTKAFTIAYCKEENSVNELSLHNVFEEVAFCIPYISEQINDIILNLDLSSHLPMTSNSLIQLNSNLFCKYYSKFFFENKNHTKMHGLFFINNKTEEGLLSECEQIGLGFNSEGYQMALNSIYTSLVSFYTDFINDKNRDEKGNYIRINNRNLQMIQAEYYNVLQKLPFMFLITFSNDYIMFKMKEQLTANIFFLCKFALIIVIDVYYFASVYYFTKEEELYKFFNESVLNTILF